MHFQRFRHLIEQKTDVPTQITQLDDEARGVTTLRVEGEMTIDDARLLERIGDDARSQTGHKIVIDLADLHFLDSESAPFLRRLNAPGKFEIQGIEIFLQTVVNQAERQDD